MNISIFHSLYLFPKPIPIQEARFDHTKTIQNQCPNKPVLPVTYLISLSQMLVHIHHTSQNLH